MYRTRYPDQPRIDAHVHVGRFTHESVWPAWLDLRARVLREVGADVAAFVELDGGACMPQWTHQPEAGLRRVRQQGQGRFYPTLTDYRPAQGLNAARPNEVASRLEQGFVGWKWHWGASFNGGPRARYGLLSDSYYAPFLAAMERAGMPLLCLHVEAPHGDSRAQAQALYTILERYPKLAVVQAHFGRQRHGTLEQHARLFDLYPNFYRELSTTAQWLTTWTSHTEARDFLIRYSDRILYGTDNMSRHSGSDPLGIAWYVRKYHLQFQWLETFDQVETRGIGAAHARMPERVRGLELPLPVLRQIYWENALRVIPHLRAGLGALGYAVGEAPQPAPAPPASAPIEPTHRATRWLGIQDNLLLRTDQADIKSIPEPNRSEIRDAILRIGGYF